MSSKNDRCVSVLAPAKINLFLEILGRRPDGYHDLRTVIVPLSLYDRVTLEWRPAGVDSTINMVGLKEAIGVKDLGNDENLATRAALALQKRTGCTQGVYISIEKRIPVGGGLGGGSSDAAATLRGLNELWKTGLSIDELSEVGLSLGCDVPALVHARSVLAEGLGERVVAVDLGVGPCRPWWVTLVNPGFSIPTREVYEAYRPALTPGDKAYRNVSLALKKGDIVLGGESLFNSLQSTVFSKYPLVEMIVERLLQAGAAGALLCGSGSTVFGLARSEQDARRLAQKAVEGLGSSVWTEVAETLPDGVMVAQGPLEAGV
jgi:4-diphosphocytidyl-2-C-methyl-D-erythritol kinase